MVNSENKTMFNVLNDFRKLIMEKILSNQELLKLVSISNDNPLSFEDIEDVQSLVYQTIKDESTRIAVNNILTNAKYAVTEQRAQLIKELNALKEENARITAESNAKVEESVAKATSIIEATNVETKTVIRG